MSKENLPQIRLIVLGDGSVGKTAVINNYIRGHNAQEVFTASTIGIDYQKTVITIGDAQYKMQIWDTAGQEKFKSLAKSFYRKANGIALFYEVRSRDSFDHLQGWISSIKENTDVTVPIVIIGNKIDLERTVTREEAEALAKEYDVPYCETSAVSGVGVNDTFQRLAKMVVDWGLVTGGSPTRPSSILVGGDQGENTAPEKKKKCC